MAPDTETSRCLYVCAETGRWSGGGGGFGQGLGRISGLAAKHSCISHLSYFYIHKLKTSYGRIPLYTGISSENKISVTNGIAKKFLVLFQATASIQKVISLCP